jgi:hypothetical protein
MEAAFPKTFDRLLRYYEKELGIGQNGSSAESEEDEEERETNQRMRDQMRKRLRKGECCSLSLHTVTCSNSR